MARNPAPQMRTHLKEDNGSGTPIPPIEDSVRVIPLGGVEEIGRNMTAVQYKDDIIVIDCGFQFKEDDTPGIDYILPNTKYLEDNKDKIRAMVVTHAHLDHIGGIPYLMGLIGNPPIYTRNLTAIMIKKRQAEFPHLPPLDIRVVEKNDRVTVGDLRLRFFSVTHTVPDSMGIIIDTPYGAVVTPGDYKLNHTDGVPAETEQKEYDKFKDENVLLMLCDSTNIENPGFSTPEWMVNENLDKIIHDIKGRLIIGTFASQLERIIGIIKIIEKYDKKLVIEGRSMKANIEIAEMAGIFKPKRGTVIPSHEAENYPPDKIVVLATGAQGEDFAALMRMANKQHKSLSIKEGDTVLLSSSIIPGNEKSVEKLKDNLARQGARIVHYRTSEVYIHSTGHGNRGEVEWLHRQIKPKFFMPVHGNHYRLKLHAELAYSLGMPKENVVVPDNGSVVEIQDKGSRIVILPEKAASNIRMVDGFAVGDMQEVVIRDRQVLAEDGMFVIIAMVNLKTGKLKKSPDIISRGFIYLRESQDLLQQTRLIAKKAVEDTTEGMNPINFDYVKKNLTDSVGSFLFQKTNKHPIVIPVVLGV
jgi:ribonuclease J